MTGLKVRRFWTGKEAAAYIGVTARTLLSWCRGPGPYENRPCKLIGPPPPYRKFARNAVRFPIQEFIEWADKPTPTRKR